MLAVCICYGVWNARGAVLHLACVGYMCVLWAWRKPGTVYVLSLCRVDEGHCISDHHLGIYLDLQVAGQ